MSIRLIADINGVNSLPEPVLQSRGYGRWGEKRRKTFLGGILEVQAHALFSASDCLIENGSSG